MALFIGNKDYVHGTKPKIGILLTNLGTPDEPTAKSLKVYLKEFLSDTRVIETPKWIWWLILNGIILNIRPAKSAKLYKSIWADGGSPLMVNARKQLQLTEKRFKDSTLKSVILSEEYRFWKFISGKKYLNENLINYDKRLLNNFYKNKGFYNVVIESSFASYLGNDEFEILYNISSGKKYYFNEFNLNLPIDYEADNFNELNNIFRDLSVRMKMVIF